MCGGLLAIVCSIIGRNIAFRPVIARQRSCRGNLVRPPEDSSELKLLAMTGRTNTPHNDGLATLFFYLSSISILLAFLLLVYSFMTSGFSVQNVFLNSSTLKPLIFKIAASWAS